MFMGKFDNGAQVGADTVVGRIVDENRLGIRVCEDRLFHLGNLHAKRNPQAGIALRIDIDRNSAAQHHGAHDAAVNISRQNDLFAALCNREDHCLYRRGGTADHQKGVCRSKRFRCQFFGFPNDRHRMAQIVQRFHRVDIHADAFFAEQSYQLRISPASLVSWNIEGNNPHLSKFFKSLIDRSTALIEMVHGGTSFV